MRLIPSFVERGQVINGQRRKRRAGTGCTFWQQLACQCHRNGQGSVSQQAHRTTGASESHRPPSCPARGSGRWQRCAKWPEKLAQRHGSPVTAPVTAGGGCGSAGAPPKSAGTECDPPAATTVGSVVVFAGLAQGSLVARAKSAAIAACTTGQPITEKLDAPIRWHCSRGPAWFCHTADTDREKKPPLAGHYQ